MHFTGGIILTIIFQLAHSVEETIYPLPNAKGVIVNVTSVNSSLPSFVTVWPTGDAIPVASTLNPRAGVPVPNQGYLRLASDGTLQAFNNAGSTDLIVDVFGYVM